MAKTSRGGEGGNSKIRFIMLEADLNGGDLTQITQAISNALRPVLPVQHQRLLPPTPPAIGSVNNGPPAAGADMDGASNDAELPIDTVTPNNGAPAAPKVQRQRSSRGRDPKLLDDLDLDGSGTSFVNYAEQKNPSTDSKRFLTVVNWFKKYGNKEAIGIDEVYTAYRMKGDWSYRLDDYDNVFRGLLRRHVVKRAGKGLYAITIAGEAEIDPAE
jgi:hypothetical protein